MMKTAQDIGRVITRYGAELILETASGGHLRCTTRRKLENVACGDYVRWQTEQQGNASVLAILPRQNVLERPDFRGKLRAVAANIDILLVVSSWRPEPNWEMLDRYLVSAHLLPAEILIVFNKADLRDTYHNSEHEICLKEYLEIGYQVVHTQANQAQGLAEIEAAIQGKTAIFAGQSGVGKSSLISQLVPEEEIRVGEIGETGEGRHTTTLSRLYHLPGQASLIDSPGVRDFPLPKLTVTQLQTGYPEFTRFAGECRFNNCTHQHEPGCAIKAALTAGELPPRRYQRYLTLLKSQSNN